MPTWEVIITSTSIQSFTVEAETMAEALQKARNTPEEERGPATVDWDFDAALVEEISELDTDEI